MQNQLKQSKAPQSGISRMDIQESIWEFMEEYGMTIDFIYKSETKEDM